MCYELEQHSDQPDSKQQQPDKIKLFGGHRIRARVYSIEHLKKFATLSSEILKTSFKS